MAECAVSILNVEKENAAHTFYDLETAKVDYFHIDVMDGKFVEKDTYELMQDYATTLSHITRTNLDVHLMVENIEEAIYDFTLIEPGSITFHIEASKTKERTMNIINDLKEYGIKVGIALNPATPIEEVLEYLPFVHKVLVMTVVPGLGGQKLIPETIEKIKALREYIDENELDVLIEADGGINGDTCSKVRDAGCDILVSGVFIVKSDDYDKNVKIIKGEEEE